MKFSFAWLTRHFRRNSADENVVEAATDEKAGGESGEEDRKPGLLKRLLANLGGRFRRQPIATEASADADAADLLSAAIPSEDVPKSEKAKVQPVTNNTVVDGEESEPELRKSSLRAKLSGLFVGLLARLRRKSKTASDSGEDDAAALFSWSEGDASPAGAGEPATIALVGSAARSESADVGDAEEGERPKTSLFTMIRLLLRKKIVVLGLLLFIVLLAIVSTGVVIYQMRANERAKLEALEKKNKQLEEENKKLQATKKKERALPPPVQPKGSEPPADKSAQAAAGSDDQPNKTSKGPAQPTGDCAVTNKDNAAAVLKKCIEEFNAMDRR